MADAQLDLDSIIPEKGEVTLGGITYIVEPPKLKTIIELSRIYKLFQSSKKKEDGGASALEALEIFHNVVEKIIPDIKKDNVDISFQQAERLIDFIMGLAAPKELKAAKAAGISPVEKKTLQPDL